MRESTFVWPDFWTTASYFVIMHLTLYSGREMEFLTPHFETGGPQQLAPHTALSFKCRVLAGFPIGFLREEPKMKLLGGNEEGGLLFFGYPRFYCFFDCAG